MILIIQQTPILFRPLQSLVLDYTVKHILDVYKLSVLMTIESFVFVGIEERVSVCSAGTL